LPFCGEHLVLLAWSMPGYQQQQQQQQQDGQQKRQEQEQEQEQVYLNCRIDCCNVENGSEACGLRLSLNFPQLSSSSSHSHDPA